MWPFNLFGKKDDAAAATQAAARQKAQEEEQARQRALADAAFDHAKGLSLGGIFNMFFMSAIVIGIGYFAMKFFKPLTDWISPEWKVKIDAVLGKVSDWLNDKGIKVNLRLFGSAIEDMTAETADKLLTGQMDDAMRKEVVANWDRLKTTAMRANGVDGKTKRLELEMLTNDKTLFAMLTQEPAMARRLIATLKPASDGEMDANAKAIVASIKKIVADPARLPQLLQGEPLKVVTEALVKFAPPGLGITAPVLERFVLDVGVTGDGKATPAFSTALNTLLNAQQGTDYFKTLVDFLTSPEVQAKPQAISTLAASIQGAPAEAKPMIDLLKVPGNVQPTIKLFIDLGPEKAQIVLQTLSTNKFGLPLLADSDAQIRAALDAFRRVPSIRQSLDKDTINSMDMIADDKRRASYVELSGNGQFPEILTWMQGKPSQTIMTEFVRNDSFRTYMRSEHNLANWIQMIGTDPSMPEFLRYQTRLANGKMGYVNAQQMFHALDQLVANNPSEDGRKATQYIMDGLVRLITAKDDKTRIALGKEFRKHSAIFSSYFANEKNQAIVQYMFDHMDGRGLPPAQKQAFIALKYNWDRADGHSLANIVADKEGCEQLFEMIADPSRIPKTDLQKFKAFFTMDQSIKDNQPALNALGAVLMNHGVIQGGAPATAPKTGARTSPAAAP